MNVDFKADTSEMRNMARYFTEKDWIRVKKRALNKAAGKLKRDTKKAFKKALPFVVTKNPKYNDTMLDAVRSSKVKVQGEGQLSVAIHVMGTRKKGSGTFRARFFEGGTKDRTMPAYTDSLGRHYKNKRSIGQIKPLYFFRDTISNMNKVQPDINGVLEEEINKLNNKKF